MNFLHNVAYTYYKYNMCFLYYIVCMLYVFICSVNDWFSLREYIQYIE